MKLRQCPADFRDLFLDVFTSIIRKSYTGNHIIADLLRYVCSHFLVPILRRAICGSKMSVELDEIDIEGGPGHSDHHRKLSQADSSFELDKKGEVPSKT